MVGDTASVVLVLGRAAAAFHGAVVRVVPKVQGDPDDVETLLDEPSCCDRRVDPSAHSDENAFASDHGPMVATAREDAAKTGIY
jgi:hypothetical protein